MFKVVSIDVGTRNLSMAILEMELPNPSEKKRTNLDTPETKACDGFFAPWQHCRVTHWENIDVLEDNGEDASRNCNLITIAKWVPLIQGTLRQRLPLFEGVDTVLIESQPSFGREKIKMVSVIIHSFFSQQYFGRVPSPPIVAFASAQLKLQVLVDPRNFYQILKKPRTYEAEPEKPPSRFVALFGKPDPDVVAANKPARQARKKNYQQRKRRAVELATAAIQHLQIPEMLKDRFHRNRTKQDDFADALLMGLGFLQRTPPKRK